MKRSIHLLIAGGLLALQVSLAVPVAGAHGTEEEHSKEPASQTAQQAEPQQNEQKTADKPLSYEFVAEPGCSLSLLARRALQLYDQQKEDVALTPAAALYAETNIVRALGSRLLDIGERVRIEQPLLDEYVQKSRNLSPKTLAAWDAYTAQASFALNDINPVDASAARTQQPGQDPKAEQQQNTEQNQQQDDPQANQDQRNDRQPLSALWWIAGLAALAALYYLLGRRRNKA